MIASRESATTFFNERWVDDHQCEWCDRSIIGRFGGRPGDSCDSCQADWDRQLEASGGRLELVA